MRKFRIWDIETKQFFYWTFLEYYPSCLTKKYVEEKSEEYSGLKDKNGKEIYEGDIVKTNTNLIRVVEYVTTLNMARYLPSHLEYAEIIGNIYENPELLKK